MTVIIEKPAINLREELADLRNQGTYQEQQFYFDGLVTNGTFDTDTNWTKGTGWTISGGVATHSGVTAGNLQQTVFEAGKKYRVYWTQGGSTFVSVYGDGLVTLLSNTDTNGSYSEDFTSSTGGALSFRSNTDGATIDNVVVHELDANDDVIHTMPKGWKLKDVYEDGLLQREGSAHDYEVIYDGFDYSIKPAVAPSATTQTCVIGVKA